MRIRVGIVCLLLCAMLSAQNERSEINKIKFYADVMTNASEAEHRMFAFNYLESIIKNYTRSKDFNLAALTQVKHIKVFPIGNKNLVSYQVLKENDQSKSVAFLIDLKGNMTPFSPSKELQDIEFERLNPTKKWIEGLYYFVKPFYQNGRKDTSYLLFSYCQIDTHTKQKVIDVLFFQDGKPILGNESFVFPKEGTRDFVQNRLVFNYSSDVVMSLSYNEENKRIVLDHLMQVKGRMPGQRSAMVPDGTYEAFLFDGNNWKYKDILYDTLKPAVNDQKRTKERRDLFGREQK